MSKHTHAVLKRNTCLDLNAPGLQPLSGPEFAKRVCALRCHSNACFAMFTFETKGLLRVIHVPLQMTQDVRKPSITSTVHGHQAPQ